MEGYKPNSVANSSYGFISKLLQDRLGEADARAILAEVDRPQSDDRRDVVLSTEDLHRVISACEWEVRALQDIGHHGYGARCNCDGAKLPDRLREQLDEPNREAEDVPEIPASLGGEKRAAETK